MLELVILGCAVWGIVNVANGRGASPWIAVAITVVGFFAIRTLILRLPIGTNPGFDSVVWSWAWVGAVALWYRFVHGRQRAQPRARWKCSRCGLENREYVLACTACGYDFDPQQVKRA